MAVTFSSLQPASGFINTPTCDSQLFRTCYSYGHAQIGAAFIGTPAGAALRINQIQSRTLAQLRQAIDGGLILDFYDAGIYAGTRNGQPYYDRRNKLCCSMTGGLPPGVTANDIWAPIRSIPPSAPTAVYAPLNYGKLMGIAQRAGIVGGRCDGSHTCTTETSAPAVPPQPTPPPPHIPNPTPAPPGVPIKQCNSFTENGSSAPETHAISVGNSREIQFSYAMFNFKDRMVIEYGNRPVYDTQCVSGSRTLAIPLPGGDDKVIVRVLPNCEGPKETRWNFQVNCPGTVGAGRPR